MMRKMGNERAWTLLLGAILASAACAGEDQTTAEDLATGSEPGTSSHALALVADAASFVSQSVPATMVGGLKYTVSITMRNDGTATWNRDGAKPYRLGSQPQDSLLWGTHRAFLPTANVTSGGLATFTFQVTAPSTPGTYDFQWQMVHEEEQWFGPVTPKVAVTVTKGVSPLYAGYYLRNWPTGEVSATGEPITQWSELSVNNPNDAPALITIRVHKQGGGVHPHAVRQQTIPAHGEWSSYGKSTWLDIPFTDLTKSASIGWIEIGADRPVIATQRLTFRKGNTHYATTTLMQDDALVTETAGTLYAPLYLKNWPTGYAGKTQWSSLVLVNPGCCAAANVTIKVRKIGGIADGTGLLGSITQSIAPGDALNTYSLPAWFNLPDANPQQGWVEVTSDRPIFGTNRVTVRNGSTSNAPTALFQEEAMSSATAKQLGTSTFFKSWPYTFSDTSRRQSSNLILVNPSGSNAQATILIYSPDGSELARLYKTVPAGGLWNSYGDTQWDNVPSNDFYAGGARGWIDVKVPDSSPPIFGINRKSGVETKLVNNVPVASLIDLDDEPLTKPPTSPGSASPSYASPYLKNWPDGGSYTQRSYLIVSNPQSSATTITLNVYGGDGSFLKSFQKPLPAFGWWNAYGDADWQAVPGASGWTELISTQPVRATNRVTLSLSTDTADDPPLVHFHDVTLVPRQP